MRIALLAVFLACSHAGTNEPASPIVPVARASATAAPEITASATASAAPADTGMFCESDSPRMPVDPNDARAACWYAGASCTGHGGQEGEQFKVTGTLVSGEFIHGGCNPGSYALVYEPSTSPLRVRVCAKRGPPQKCPATIREGASWDVAPLLQANHATGVTIVMP